MKGAALRNPRAGVEHFSSGVFARPFEVYRGTSSELGRDEMRDGLRVYDADTHVEPTAEVIDTYVDPAFRPRLADLAQYRQPVRAGAPGGAPGRHVYRYGQISYKRILGEAVPRETHSGRDTQWMGSKQPRPGTQDDQADSRVKDMDDEGTDAHFLIPTSWTSFVGHEDPTIEVNVIRAFHRHMQDFSSQHPDRLQSMIVASARDVDSAVKAIRQWGKARSTVAVLPLVTKDIPADHPAPDAIWRAAAEHHLPIA